ncbi:hypothetical protein NDU88_005832 [Pleurodeles waltl]|uniref:Uncharacterized protein n=1 Tax=Pleurodeles waltl TaxID=8319 RepID=A0AAV7UKE1_PLEWA|nr:hypothetical protein NDU88_005832 [Pleurodeles waltl]
MPPPTSRWPFRNANVPTAVSSLHKSSGLFTRCARRLKYLRFSQTARIQPFCSTSSSRLCLLHRRCGTTWGKRGSPRAGRGGSRSSGQGSQHLRRPFSPAACCLSSTAGPETQNRVAVLATLSVQG